MGRSPFGIGGAIIAGVTIFEMVPLVATALVRDEIALIGGGRGLTGEGIDTLFDTDIGRAVSRGWGGPRIDLVITGLLIFGVPICWAEGPEPRKMGDPWPVWIPVRCHQSQPGRKSNRGYTRMVIRYWLLPRHS